MFCMRIHTHNTVTHTDSVSPTVNTLLINTEYLSPSAAGRLFFVLPAGRRVRFRFVIGAPRLDVISEVQAVSVIGILYAQVVFHAAERL